MTAKSAFLGIGWLAGMTVVCAAMLACMLGHIVKNRVTIGRWWT